MFIRAVNIEAASIEINGINAQGGHLSPSNARISQYSDDGGVPSGMVLACGTGPSEHEALMAFVSPGQPWHNGFVESLHNRMRDELREDNLFEDLTHARVMLDW
ncbi:integrase core domain-containing protein [Corynebacterium macclintockiae]|uniref:integrase core domain-containing protein n=1 Tax=Corynebacterium macclintockiae TaxID=2913501 RepID=UPI00254D587C|nr:integrase core domain-containing protein [Corynebacterium macclintockiae]MDK8891171.1 integrase core domain-containing protein [Corynebacterium macclintockiae]